MHERDKWVPSKFDYYRGRLRASRDTQYVALRSRLIVDAVAAAYEVAIRGHARGALADAGCGRVPLYQCYVDLVDEIICIDWMNSVHASPHVDLHADLNASLPLPDARVDTVLATDVLEHLSRPEIFWAEVKRVLRPGGKLILGVPFLYWLHEEPHDHYRYTSHRLTLYCEEHGLDLVSIASYGGPVTVVFDIIAKNIPRRLTGLWQLVAETVLRLPPVRRFDQRRSEAFPLGYCLVAQNPPNDVHISTPRSSSEST